MTSRVWCVICNQSGWPSFQHLKIKLLNVISYFDHWNENASAWQEYELLQKKSIFTQERNMTTLMTSAVLRINDSVESIREWVLKYYSVTLVIIGAIKIIKLRSLIRIFFLHRAGQLSVREAQDVVIIWVSNTFSFFPLLLYYYQMLSDCGVCS